MFVRVVVVLQDDPTLVRFLCPAGTGIAAWSGPMPVLGEPREIDWAVDDEFVWGETAGEAGLPSPRIASAHDGGLLVRAQVTSVDPRVGVRIALADDKIVIKLDGARPDLVGQWIDLHARKVTLSLADPESTD